MSARMQLRSIPFCFYVDPNFPVTFFPFFASTLEQVQSLPHEYEAAIRDNARRWIWGWDGVGDSGWPIEDARLFCSSDVLYLQKYLVPRLLNHLVVYTALLFLGLHDAGRNVVFVSE